MLPSFTAYTLRPDEPVGSLFLTLVPYPDPRSKKNSTVKGKTMLSACAKADNRRQCLINSLMSMYDTGAWSLLDARINPEFSCALYTKSFDWYVILFNHNPKVASETGNTLNMDKFLNELFGLNERGWIRLTEYSQPTWACVSMRGNLSEGTRTIFTDDSPAKRPKTNPKTTRENEMSRLKSSFGTYWQTKTEGRRR